MKRTVWLGCVTFSLLAGLAAVFYRERMTFLDMAFQTFHILRTGALQIQSGRFGAAGTQVFAWAAQALGLPLKGVLLSYSVGHVLYYFAIFLLLTLGLRQWRWGLVLILLATSMTTHTFYWLSEMPQGLAFLVLVLAWLHSKGAARALAWPNYILLAAAVTTAVYFHPMVLYGMVFCSLFFLLPPLPASGGEHRYSRALQLLALGMFLAVVFLKYKVLKLDWYDAMSLERAKVFAEIWPDYWDIKSNHDFLKWCLSDYYCIPVLAAFNTGFYVWNRNWPKAALSFFFPAGYVLLVNIPFHAGDNQFYLENLYLPLALFTAVPLVFEVLPGLLPDPKMIGVIAVIAGLGLVRIYHRHTFWSERVRWEQSFLEQTAALPKRKLVLSEQQTPMPSLILSWGSAYEFLMLSALEHPDSARCILIDETPERFDSLLARPGLFLGEFKNYPTQELPRRYFNIRDTSAYVRFR